MQPQLSVEGLTEPGRPQYTQRMETAEKKYISLDEIAARLEISRPTAVKRLSSGEIRVSWFRLGSLYKVSRRDYERWEREQLCGAGSAPPQR